MTPDTSTVSALIGQAEEALRTGAFADAKPLLDQALAEAEGAGDSAQAARVEKLLGDFFRYQSNPYEAGALYEKVLKSAAENADKRLLADVQLAYGRLKMPQGQQDNAWLLYEAAGEIYDSLGEVGLKGQTIGGRGDVASHKGDLATARALYEEGLALCKTANDALGQAHTLKSLGRLVQQTEGAAAALEVLKSSLDAYKASGFRYGEAFTWQYYAQVLGQEGRLPEAADALGHAIALFEALQLAAQAGRMRDFKAQVEQAIADGLG